MTRRKTQLVALYVAWTGVSAIFVLLVWVGAMAATDVWHEYDNDATWGKFFLAVVLALWLGLYLGFRWLKNRLRRKASTHIRD